MSIEGCQDSQMMEDRFSINAQREQDAIERDLKIGKTITQDEVEVKRLLYAP